MIESVDMPKLLSVTETAKALRVHPDTVRAMVFAGTIHGVRVGEKVIRIREADVLAILNGKAVQR